MNRTFSSAYTLCALLFVLVLSVVFLLRLNDSRNREIAAAEARFTSIVRDLQYHDPPLDSIAIQRILAASTTGRSSLRAVAVYTFEGGLEYLWSMNRRYLADDLSALPVPLSPEFTYHQLTEVSLSRRIPASGGRTVIVEAVYRVIPSSIWYRLFHDTLLAVLVFAVLTVVVTVVVLLAGGRSQRRAGARDSHPPESDRSAPPEPQTAAPRSAPEGRGNQPADRDSQTGMFNPNSGLTYEAHLPRRLALELERAASNDQDLAFVHARFPGLSRGTDGYRSCARAMVEQFLFEDLIFEQGQDSFAVVMPNTDLNRAIKQVEHFYSEIKATPLPGRPFFGITARSGRLVEADRLIREAQHALQKAHSEQQTILAFRADPQKYRDFVAQQSG
ncbi:MAG: GGDEF domain-containing protein [Spirochaetaceae bacterium]|nr:MAG: GGDEF domain-containing protein [Spirochaetaceae bacterium]